MKPEIKERWLTALRSGEYQQGIMSLRVNDKFCCLGVLCDLHAKETNTNWVKEDPNDLYMTEDLYHNNGAYLSPEVMDWSGMLVASARVRLKEPVTALDDDGKVIGTFETATALNDSGLFTFAQIADILEKNL